MSLKRPSGCSHAAAAVVLLGLVWSAPALAAGPNDPRPVVGGEDSTQVRAAPPAVSATTTPTRPAAPPTSGTTSGSTPVVQAPPAQAAPPATTPAAPPTPTDTSGTEDTGANPAAGAPAATSGSSPETPLLYAALGGVILLLALGVLAYFQLLQRIAQVQRLAAARPEPRPAVTDDASGSFMLDPGALASSGQNPWNDQSRTPTNAADLARLLGANGGRVEAPTALVSLAGALSELINHTLDNDEKLNLVSRAVERHVRAGAAPPDNLSRLIDERIEASQARPLQVDEAEPAPVRAAPPARPVTAEPANDGLWGFAERLFRRVGLTNVTEEVFLQALSNKKAEILADGSYAQRPELLRNNPQAQNIAGVLRLASSEWANRSDEVTIPVGYRAAFADFIEAYADPGADFELIWANSGESAKDSAHETSRIDGVRHEVVSGVRWPGLRGGGEVYMRAKVAIA